MNPSSFGTLDLHKPIAPRGSFYNETPHQVDQKLTQKLRNQSTAAGSHGSALVGAVRSRSNRTNFLSCDPKSLTLDREQFIGRGVFGRRCHTTRRMHDQHDTTGAESTIQIIDDPHRGDRLRAAIDADNSRRTPLTASTSLVGCERTIMPCANTVLLSGSIYTSFPMLNVDDYVDSTSVDTQRRSQTPTEAGVVGGLHV